MAKNLLKKPSRALDITANIATAAASRNSKKVLSTPPDVINFYHTGKRFFLPRIAWLYTTWMEQKTDGLYPSAPFEKKKFWFRTMIRKKMNDVNSFSNSINNIQEIITYFKDKNYKSKKSKKYKMLTTSLNSYDTFVIIATTSGSITLSLTWMASI